MRTTPLVFALAIISIPVSSRAAENCDGWFCDEPSKLAGEAVAVELQDGSVVRGVVVEIAADHVTIAVGDSKVTVTWAQIVSIKINPPSAPTNAPKPTEVPEATPEEKAEPVDDEEEVVEQKPEPKPAAAPAPIAKEVEQPAPKPAFQPGLFALGARAKLFALMDGRFHNGSEQISAYATGGVGYELSFAVRLTSMLMLRASYEHAELFRGERNYSTSALPTSDAIGIGARILFGSAPDVRGVFEAGVGYRWLNVPYSNGAPPDGSPRRSGSGVAMYEGTESLRSAIGAAFTLDDHGRFEVLLEGAFGRFSRVHDDNAVTRTRELGPYTQTPHAFVGLSVGLELGP